MTSSMKLDHQKIKLHTMELVVAQTSYVSLVAKCATSICIFLEQKWNAMYKLCRSLFFPNNQHIYTKGIFLCFP